MRFDLLHIFAQHHSRIQTLLATEDIFVVGGAIRDVLLGIANDPQDIDITCAGNPEHIRQDIEKNNTTMSIFRTEKYGTMTLLDPEKTYSYELTPFRMEGGYTDVRHPDDITRSNDIVADSKRRDFTINACYLTYIPYSRNTATQAKKIHTDEQFLQALDKGPCLYLINSHTLIIQDHTIIQQIIHQGLIQKDILATYIEQAHSIHYGEQYLSDNAPLSLLIDPQHGLQDMIHRTIRTVGSAQDRFTEDALRILRGVRFPNILNQHLPDRHVQNKGFTYNKETRSAMIDCAHLITQLAKERIHQELVKVFSGDNPFGYVALLDELGLIELLFPELAACKHNTQPTLYHPFDTYTHTLLTLQALQQLGATNYCAKFAMLYHDVGKPDQYAYISQQKEKGEEAIDMSGYLHHTETGAEMAVTAFKKLGFSKKECEEIARYIKRHHRPGEILESNPKNQEKKIRKLLSEGGIERCENLIYIAIADRTGQYNPLQPAAVEQLYTMLHHIQQIHKDEGRFTLHELAVNGTLLMEELGISAGPELGMLLENAFDRVLGDVPKRNTKQAILQHLKSRIE